MPRILLPKKKLIVGLLTLLAVGGLSGLLTNLTSQASGIGLSWSSSLSASTSTPTPLMVAANVQALYQGDPTIGWDSSAQYQLWWPSACSPAALTMALRAWGQQVTIGQVLDRLVAHHAITPEQGLLNADALTQVAREYSFQATTFKNWNAQKLALVTAQGVPVLVDLVDAKQQTPYPGFVVGHWLVVIGVNASHISVRDSSGYHIHSFQPAIFHTLFTGIGIVLWKGVALSLPT